MANVQNNPEKNDKQSDLFNSSQELKSEVYDFIEKQLAESIEKEFKNKGYEANDVANKKGEQGWNRGVYGDGTMYGAGVDEDKYTITINRTKGGSSTNSFFSREVTFGTKKLSTEISLDVKGESKKININYKNTEQSLFTGNDDIINIKMSMDLKNMSKFKKDIKKKFDELAEKEIRFLVNSKIGVEDRVEKELNIESMTRKSMKLSDILRLDFSDVLNVISESKKTKDSKEHHPDVAKNNKKGKLLFDDLESIEESKGADFRKYFEKKMKGFGANTPEELKPSEYKSIDISWETDKDAIDEMTSSGAGAGSAGAFAFDTNKFGRSKKHKFEDTNYAKRGSKRGLKRVVNEGDTWTTVEFEPGTLNMPKGMNKDHAMGLHGVDVNSKEEDDASKGSPKGRAAIEMSEANLTMRKFTTDDENSSKGINKRYIITHKLSEGEQKSRWSKLSTFQKNETIKVKESHGYTNRGKKVSLKESEIKNISDDHSRNLNVREGESVNGREVMVVRKPNSLSNVKLKVYKDDFLNENRAFLLDLNTGVQVRNPNFGISQ